MKNTEANAEMDRGNLREMNLKLVVVYIYDTLTTAWHIVSVVSKVFPEETTIHFLGYDNIVSQDNKKKHKSMILLFSGGIFDKFIWNDHRLFA